MKKNRRISNRMVAGYHIGNINTDFTGSNIPFIPLKKQKITASKQIDN